jgi:hypothetical protein
LVVLVASQPKPTMVPPEPTGTVMGYYNAYPYYYYYRYRPTSGLCLMDVPDRCEQATNTDGRDIIIPVGPMRREWLPCGRSYLPYCDRLYRPY